MKKQNKSFAVGVGIGVVATFFVQFLLAVAIAITGGYDVAASRDHTPLVRWMLNTIPPWAAIWLRTSSSLAASNCSSTVPCLAITAFTV